jgi:hypothetical protein
MRFDSTIFCSVLAAILVGAVIRGLAAVAVAFLSEL